jgi:excisionase family DNA binding protein
MNEILEAVRAVIREELKQLTTLPGQLITEKELCDFLDVSTPTIIKWRNKGKIPCIRIGSAVRYDKAAVIKALEQKQAS